MAPGRRPPALLRAIAILALAQMARGVLTRQWLTALDPLAVCTDGSTAAYYWEEATSEEGRDTWIVHLQSGGWCWDEASCTERCAQPDGRCGTGGWEQEITGTGILSDEYPDSHPRLRTANKAFLRYCTSDAHMGDGAAFGYQFRGTRVVQAMLADLVTRHGLGSGDGGRRDLLVFGGNSAGSRGAMVHLDYVASMIGTAAAANVQVMGFLDSPLWVDVAPLDASFEGFVNQTRRVYGFANITHLGEDCAAAYAEPLSWRCIFGEYRLRFLRTPALVVASLQDAFQVDHNLANGGWVGSMTVALSWTEDQLAYTRAFSNKTAALVKLLASPSRPVLAPACHSHAESLSDAGFFSHGGSDGTTMNEALLRLLNLTQNTSRGAASNATGGDADAALWVDSCEGIDCGRYCRRGDQQVEDVVVTLGGAPRTASTSAVVALVLPGLALALRAWARD